MSGLRLLPGRPPAALLAPIVRALTALGVTPAALTWAGLAGNVAAGALVGSGALLAGGAVMLVASGLDMLDGALARATARATPAGALLDSTLDRVSEAAVLAGVLLYALDRDDDTLAALSFVAVAGSLLVSYVRARVEGLGAKLTDGLFTRAERVVVLGVALLVGALTPALWLLAVLTPLTAAQRLWLGLRTLRQGGVR